MLNKLKIASSQPSHPSSELAYAHHYLIDSFYSPSDSHEKIRVTTNEKTGEVIECIKKIRLKDLNIYSPKRAVDWRVSVSLEVPGMYPSFLGMELSVYDYQFLYHLDHQHTREERTE